MLTALLNNNLLKLLNTSKGELETIEFSSEIVKDSKILNIDTFSTQLKEKIETKKWVGKKVFVGLNEENTYLASVQVGKDDKNYLALVNKAVSENIPFPPEDLYITTKIVSKTDSTQTVQIAAVEKAFLDSFANALVNAGLKPDYFVPMPLGLASLVQDKEKPQLLVSSDEKEVFYVFVGEEGVVQFCATYPLTDVIQSTEQVVKYLSDKFPEHPVRKTIVYGHNADEIIKKLKKNGLVVEGLGAKAKQYPLMEIIKEFNNAKLIFMPPHTEKDNSSDGGEGGILSIFKNKKQLTERDETDITEKNTDLPDSAISMDLEQVEKPEKPEESKESQEAKEPEEPEKPKESDLPTPLESQESDPETQSLEQQRMSENGSDFLKSGNDNTKKYILLGLGGFAIIAFLAVALVLMKPWEGKEEGGDVVEPAALETESQESSQEESEESAESAEQESPVVSDQESKESFVRSDYTTQILNGRGTPGLAGTTRDSLLELGWVSIEVGNGNERDLSIVQYKEGEKVLAETLMRDLADDFEFTEPEPLDPLSSFDAVIIIGDK